MFFAAACRFELFQGGAPLFWQKYEKIAIVLVNVEIYSNIYNPNNNIRYIDCKYSVVCYE